MNASQRFNDKKVAILPARWGSSRFPGKPLAEIAGKSLIRRTYESISSSKKLDRVIVATDDKRIYDHVLEFGGQCVMTSESCSNGTERVGEAARLFCPEAEIIVNVQGDEPCMPSYVIDKMIEEMELRPEVQIVTPVSVGHDEEEIFTERKVKCVFDQNGRALYFSRSLIPSQFKVKADIYIHLGVYAFRRDSLETYLKLPKTPLSLSEDLEQLRILESGGSVHVCMSDVKPPSVDYPEDIKKVENYLLCHLNACS
ncbi:3-deoxy-manno-octulosonate cytidylyltransferase [Chlamydiifrater phoenicopteri]|uniref:3-deoxy-manno-octulosonate cytidylyltransferase n=1 Tax=Chlamydiifrater phoenicopteri TaxID=2681469 RepID=UPI001BD0B2AB|nr:3-deoxy-manno-octulosonate cytidylyltransferase [Chlamydiifrater phoenicopteri]